MDTFRFQILCTDNVWRYVFCRTRNGGYDIRTDSAVIATDSEKRAFTSYGYDQAKRDLAYFDEHSHGRHLRFA